MTHFNLRFSRRQIFQSWRQYQHKKRVLCCKHHQVRHHLIASPGQHSLFTSLLALHRPQAESDHMTEKHRGREKEEKGGKLINAEHTKGTSDKGSKGNFPCVHLALCWKQNWEDSSTTWLLVVLPPESTQQGLGLSFGRCLSFQQGNGIWLTTDGSFCTFQSLSGEGACFHNLLANQFPLVNTMVSVLGCSHTLMHTDLYQIYIHTSYRVRGREEKGELEGVEKEEEVEAQQERWAIWKTLEWSVWFYFAFYRKRKQKKEKKRPTEKLPLGLTRLPQAHYLWMELELNLHKGSCFGWVGQRTRLPFLF